MARHRLEKLSNFSNIAICAVMLFIVAFLAVVSVLFTTYIDPEGVINEEAVYLTDNLLLNLLLTAAFLAVVIMLKRFIYRVPSGILATAVCTAAFIISCVWIFSVKSVPAHDSAYLLNMGEQLAGVEDHGYTDSSVSQYFFTFPFQLGYAAICEIFARIFSGGASMALQVLNAVAVSAMFAALIMLVGKVFGNKKYTNMTAIMLLGCAPIMLITTFVYGLVLSFALACWAMYFTVCILKEPKRSKKIWIYTAAMVIVIAAAYVAKPNSAVALIAIVAVLVLDFLKCFEARKLFIGILAVICTLSASAGVRAVIEARLGCDFGDGVPMTAWLCIGMNESESAPGWWAVDTNASALFKRNGLDAEKTAEEASEIISERLEAFSDQSYLNDFVYKKIVSQWNDPSYESIWISLMKSHDGDYAQYVKDIYDAGSDSALYGYMNLYQQAVFIFAVIGLVVFLRKKDSAATLLVLCIFGGFLYHLLFEAKSQYVITYFTALVPICAIGLVTVADKLGAVIKSRLPNGLRQLVDRGQKPDVEYMPDEVFSVDIKDKI